MQIVGLSRHIFEKIISEGVLTIQVDENGKKFINSNELNEFMQTDRYNELLKRTILILGK